MQRSNVFHQVTCQAIALVLALVAGGLILQAADPEAVPLQAAPGLFNTTDTDTLGLQKVPGQHRMIYRASETGYKFCHHPQLVVFQDRCYAMWSNGILAEDTPGQRILYCSTSDGTNWTKPRVLTDHDAGKGICVAAGFRVHEKQLIAYYTVTGGTNFHPATALYARLSSDGKQWSPARRITSGFFINPPVELANGHLVIGGEHVGERRTTARMRLLVTEQANGLAGWKRSHARA